MTLHLPQTTKTEGMINRNVLAAVKPGTILLNFARGGLIDDDAVIEALESGQLGRYVTDFPNDRIIANPKVIAMPHLGASTLEAEGKLCPNGRRPVEGIPDQWNHQKQCEFSRLRISPGGGLAYCHYQS